MAKTKFFEINSDSKVRYFSAYSKCVAKRNNIEKNWISVVTKSFKNPKVRHDMMLWIQKYCTANVTLHSIRLIKFESINDAIIFLICNGGEKIVIPN